ncbi:MULTISPECIES: amidase [unclassified Polaromonas]|uniref:amidase n=1 Tax=unclassified Polaromonas TaxID=2638319 RepID=UPI0018C93453|nr:MULTISPECIES: amidase [unclassified Polaromonas]MBG6073692.1 amidase [Polaromonas sp. CG_9.7]MBG6115694.1 amidase [Polaromonas sp. CG_9.2]MDH6186638.1 amidase [Polaromonas sp. CG_23.6]
MTQKDLHYLELLEIGKLIQSKELSSVEATQAQLDRIGKLNGVLKSYVTVMADSALVDAQKADAEIAAGELRGLLHGVPIAVKDLCWTKGVKTAAGMTIYEDFVPTVDGTVVKKLREAGAIILGKLQMTESAYADHHPTISPPVNPWNAAHWTGVSSSGSGVSTAAGLCYGSLGTDTGGSIRFPSAANGLTGLKPTWGRVSRYGAFELAATLDHIGPMTRSAADAGAMLGVIAGSDINDPTASLRPVPNYVAEMPQGIKGLRVGIDSRWSSDGVDEPTKQVLAAAIAAVKTLGGEIREVVVPDPAHAIEDWFPLCGMEAAVVHEKTYAARKSEYGPGLAGLIELGLAQKGTDYQKIMLRRLDFTGRVKAMFEDIDLLLVPATGIASPTVDRMSKMGTDAELISAVLRYTCPFDMTGSPTITLPGGFTEGGMPLAFQFVSRHFEESLLLRAGWAFQQITDWHRQHPSL